MRWRVAEAGLRLRVHRVCRQEALHLHGDVAAEPGAATRTGHARPRRRRGGPPAGGLLRVADAAQERRGGVPGEAQSPEADHLTGGLRRTRAQLRGGVGVHRVGLQEALHLRGTACGTLRRAAWLFCIESVPLCPGRRPWRSGSTPAHRPPAPLTVAGRGQPLAPPAAHLLAQNGWRPLAPPEPPLLSWTLAAPGRPFILILLRRQGLDQSRYPGRQVHDEVVVPRCAAGGPGPCPAGSLGA
mmetsp:Transcript_74613/g.241236  ORF Transcript_74613/g.241236 Transcript_74613/m.241236 type:complete len:242 (-) Transcript_74613:167-892(-)